MSSKEFEKTVLYGLATAILAGCSSAPGAADALRGAEGPLDAGVTSPKGMGALPAGSVRDIVVVLEPDATFPDGVLRAGRDIGIYRLRPGEDASKAVERLSSNPGILAAHPNVQLAARLPLPRKALTVGFQVQNGDSATDPMARQQWHLAKIGASQAWPMISGEPVTAAVIDSGADVGHPDLAPNLRPGVNVTEDEVGGPLDELGHGTHVAGIIGAVIDNGIGVAGIAPRVRILPIRASHADGRFDILSQALAIGYAEGAGARVINMSFGSTADNPVIREVVRRCLREGIVIVAAAGNEGSPLPNYPAGFPGVISVGATDPRDSRAEFSNYGTPVDFAAPGVDILSTYPRRRAEGDAEGGEGDGFATLSGTSMAAPIVSGIVASMLSIRPGLTPPEVVAILRDTGKPTTGFGADVRRVDFAGAIRAIAKEAPPAPTPAPSASPSTPPVPPCSNAGSHK